MNAYVSSNAPAEFKPLGTLGETCVPPRENCERDVRASRERLLIKNVSANENKF